MISAIDKLRVLIEKSLGREIKTPKDFSFLSERIFERLHQQISPTTLKRIWGYQQDEGPSRIGTLNILAQFCAYTNWNSFVEDCDKGSSQSTVILKRHIYVDDLQKGNTLQLTWAPDRCCEVEYLGLHSFRILSAQNSKLKAGNTFKCDVFIENEPLYLYDLIQEDNPPVCYAAGSKDGIRFEMKR